MSARTRRTIMATPLRRRLAAAAGIVALAVVAASCAAVPVQSLVRGSVASASTATGERPVVEPFLRPLPIPAAAARPGEAAYAAPTADGHEVRIHVVLGTGPLPHRTLLVLPGSEGFRASYLDHARELAVAGTDVVVGCWAAGSYPSPSPATDCSAAQPRTAVVESTVPTVAALVDAARAATGAGATQVSILGYSRGAGVALLWAARTGANLPIVDLAGMVTGEVTPYGGAGAAPDEVNVVSAAATLPGPLLVIHSRGDTMVVPGQSDALIAARTVAGHAVTAHWIGALCGVSLCNHDVLAGPASAHDVVVTTSTWLAEQA